MDDFNQRFNFDIPKSLRLLELGSITSPSWTHGFAYSGTSERAFNQMMNSLSIQYDKFIFIDLGSGKGKVLLMAANWPFSKIIGIEYSRALHKIAVLNIEAYKKIKGSQLDIELICDDAVAFQWPPYPSVVYMYNPFDSTIMKQIANNILY